MLQTTVIFRVIREEFLQ